MGGAVKSNLLKMKKAGSGTGLLFLWCFVPTLVLQNQQSSADPGSEPDLFKLVNGVDWE